jgi:ribulose-phosphate 3-epimerase
MNKRHAEISASILNADFARLGDEVLRAVEGGVDSIHLDVMDGHFVDNISMGPVVVDALRPHTALPFHSHLMISQPLRFVEEFANAGSDLIVFHVEADDPPRDVIEAIHRTGRGAGIALNPETPADAVLPYREEVDLLLVMTVHPGFGGQAFIAEVMPKLRALRADIDGRGLALPLGIDGGVNLETIAPAYAAGGDVMVTGSVLYRNVGDLRPVVDELRAAATAGQPTATAGGEAGASVDVAQAEPSTPEQIHPD